MQNKVTILSNAKALAFSSGDLDRMNAIENDLLGTQNTLSQLEMLLAATQAANTQNLNLSSVVTAGVLAAQNAALVPVDPTAVLSQYDISTYASDPAYIQKITDMLLQMPVLENAVQIDTYISNEIVGSPITGQMVMDAATKYNVDTRLMVSIMELDSRLGTAGTGAQTFNPGNVGNTGTIITTYASWADGVAAVAYWLSKHRIDVPKPVTVTPDAAVAPVNAVPVPTEDTISTKNTNQNTASTTLSTTTPLTPSIDALPVPIPVTVVSTSTSPVMLTVTASTTDPVVGTIITTTTATSTATTTATTAATSTEAVSTSTPAITTSTSTADTTIDNSSSIINQATTTEPLIPDATSTPTNATTSPTSMKGSQRKIVMDMKRVIKPKRA